MDSCHYCCDTIEKLNNEYAELQNEYEKLNNELIQTNKIAKRFSYNNCLKYIHLIRIDMEQSLELAIQSDPNVNQDRDEEIECWTFSVENFMNQIEWFNSDGDWEWLNDLEKKLQSNR